MANLTSSQKKSRNSFVALLIGIVVVALAIAYVVYGGLTSKSKLLDNQNFAAAIAEAIGKTPLAVSEEDLADIKYFELAFDAQSKQYTMAVGYDEFIAEYEKQLAKAESEEETADEETVDFSKLIKTASFKGNEEDIFTDVKYLKGVNTISLGAVKLPEDVSFDGFENLKRGYFNSANITKLDAFANLNLDNIVELDFSGNTISDWTILEPIADKVTVFNGYTIEMDEDENYQYVPYTQTLTDYLKEQEEAEKAEAETAEGEATEGEAVEGDTTEEANSEAAPEADAQAEAETETEQPAEAE